MRTDRGDQVGYDAAMRVPTLPSSPAPASSGLRTSPLRRWLSSSQVARPWSMTGSDAPTASGRAGWSRRRARGRRALLAIAGGRGTLVGHSFGGVSALQAAVDGLLLDGLVLAAAPLDPALRAHRPGPRAPAGQRRCRAQLRRRLLLPIQLAPRVTSRRSDRRTKNEVQLALERRQGGMLGPRIEHHDRETPRSRGCPVIEAVESGGGSRPAPKATRTCSATKLSEDGLSRPPLARLLRRRRVSSPGRVRRSGRCTGRCRQRRQPPWSTNVRTGDSHEPHSRRGPQREAAVSLWRFRCRRSLTPTPRRQK